MDWMDSGTDSCSQQGVPTRGGGFFERIQFEFIRFRVERPSPEGHANGFVERSDRDAGRVSGDVTSKLKEVRT
ncbi:MAG: hypothetical protein QF752_09590 [Planctomycetota bacterium]|nr:hypothetical protein [Planctomycetota bacterium]